MKNNFNLAGCARRSLFLKILILLAICVARQPAGAAPMDAKQAASAVQGWLKVHRKPLNETLGNTVLRVDSFKDDAGNVAWHIVYLKPSGFVIVSGDDGVEPVVGFAAGGVFDPSPGNSLGALVAKDLPGRVALARQGRPAPKAAALWQQYEQAATNTLQLNALSSIPDVRVAPFVQSTWSQTTVGGAACYNYYTPTNAAGNANNYPCGCVATAMGQIMRYFQYPTTGVGTASFNITVNGVTQSRSLRGGNGSGGPYDWANMSLTPGASISTAGRQAIGALLSDAGVSVNMNYASDGSGAVAWDACLAFVNTFHYGNSIGGWNRNLDLGANLIGMLNPSLDARLPVLLSISGPPGGHAIVADGYGYSGSTLYHHLNFGWSGSANAWYNLPYMDTSNGTFNLIDQSVYNIYTNGTGEIISGRVLDQNANPLPGVTVTATRSGGGTWTATTDANGIYALTRLTSKSQYTLVAAKPDYTSATGVYSTGTSVNDGPASGNFWGANFTLNGSPNALDHFDWTLNSNPALNTPFSVTLAARNQTNGLAAYTGTAHLSAYGALALTNVIVGNLGNLVSDSYSFNCTDGYDFTPNTTLQVVAVRSYFGTTVSIWNSSKTLLASRNVVSQPGAWVETPLAAPLTLTAGNTYRIGIYYAAGTTAYYTFSWPASFPGGAVGQTYYYGSGANYPTSVLGSGVGPLVDLSYTYQGTNDIPLTPTTTGLFTNSLWTGNLTLLQNATNIMLKADSGSGQTGIYGPFNFVTLQPQLAVAPNQLDFGGVTVGNNALQTFTLTNIGSGTLSGSVTAGSPFSVVNGSPFSLNAGQAGTVSIAFTPTAAAAYNGQVTFTSNGGNSTNAVTGSGVVAPPLTPLVISISIASNDVLIRFPSDAGRQYEVQRSAVLPFTNGVTVATVSGTGALIEVKDAGALTHATSFYRVRRQ